MTLRISFLLLLPLLLLAQPATARGEAYGSLHDYTIDTVSVEKDMEGKPQVKIMVEYGQEIFCPAQSADAAKRIAATLQQLGKGQRIDVRYEPLGEGMMDALTISAPDVHVDCERRH